MNIKEYNFDQVIERKNTNSLKYDFAARRGMPEDVLPLWVADMDFKTAEPILEAIRQRVDHGIFGYTEVLEDYFEPLKAWMKKRHHWDVEQRWLIKTPGVVYALAMAVQAFTESGDGVLIQQPVYYPFREVIEANGREVVDNTLRLGADEIYHIDFNDFEEKIIKYQVKLFLLCSPHNPVGRVWSREELLEIARICLKHHVLVVSDEIHHDIVFAGHKHFVFADICPEIKDQVIVCTSPSKTFNIAGLQISNIFIPNQGIRQRFRRRINAAGYSQLNAVGLTACAAAYGQGEDWLNGVLTYIQTNIDYLRNFLKERIPKVKPVEPQGTYLVWLDLRGLGVSAEKLDHIIINKARLWLDAGSIFGAAGEGFQRINAACPQSILSKALKQMEKAFMDENLI